jgi:hypothetical protein
MLRSETIPSYIERAKWAAVLVTVSGLLVLRFVQSKQRCQAPPGPKRLPLLGNVLNFPRSRWYEVFSQWKNDYGPFHSFRDLL